MVVKPKSWQVNLMLLAILLAAFWIRTYRLEAIPSGLHFDEAANAILSSEIAFDGYRPIFISSYTGKETLFFYAAGLLMNRIGVSVFALRLTAGFMGLLTLAVTYRLGVHIFGRQRDAVIAVLILGGNFSHLLFSRLGFRAISQPLLQALTVLFLLEGMRRLRKRQPARLTFSAAGVFLGLTAHTYLAARLFPIALVIPLIIFAWLWFRDGKSWSETRPYINHYLLMGLIGLVALSPLLYWFVANPESFWVRIGQVGNTDQGVGRLEGILIAINMLFFDGDPYIRFNIPDKPVFFRFNFMFAAPWMMLIWFEKQKQVDERWLGRLIILIAPFIMLLPSGLATSEIVPSNLRAIGIFPFIAFWIAMPISWMLDSTYVAFQKQKSLHASLAAFVAVILIIPAFIDPAIYLTSWGNDPRAFYETEGDVQAVAAHLNELETDRPIFVSTRFVPHPTLAFLADGYDDIQLIPDGQTLVYPAGKPPYIVYPYSAPEPLWLKEFDGERENFRSENGLPAYSTFVPAGGFPSPQNVADGNFGFAAELLGYDLEEGKMGGTMELRTYYNVLGNPGFNMVPFVHLEDEFGNRWTQLEQPGYSPAAWQVGDLFVQHFNIPIEENMPPVGNYTVRTGWFDGDSGKEVTRFNSDGQFAGAAFLIEDVAVAYAEPNIDYSWPPPTFQQEVAPNLHIQSVEFNQPSSVFQGDQINFAMSWVSDEIQPAAKLITTLSADGQLVEIESFDPINNQLPFTAWPADINLKDYHRVQVPVNLEPGEWTLQTVYAPANGDPVEIFSAEINVQPLDLILETPQVEQSIGASFDGQIKLVGATIDQATNELELVWQKVGEIETDYFAFVHLQNSDGTCCVWQADRRLVSSADRPTSRWLKGEFVIDTYQIEADLGGFPLWVGLYRPENGIRLQVDGASADQIQVR